MEIRWKTPADDEWLSVVLSEHWGGTRMIVRGEAHDLLGLPTIPAGQRDGLAIFVPRTTAELVVLHAVRPHHGVGSALLSHVVKYLRSTGARVLRATTTNDNLDAIRFYQRRGFQLTALRRNAVEDSRLRKPSIPNIGEFGIPIRDELDLELVIT